MKKIKKQKSDMISIEEAIKEFKNGSVIAYHSMGDIFILIKQVGTRKPSYYEFTSLSGKCSAFDRWDNVMSLIRRILDQRNIYVFNTQKEFLEWALNKVSD